MYANYNLSMSSSQSTLLIGVKPNYLMKVHFEQNFTGGEQTNIIGGFEEFPTFFK